MVIIKLFESGLNPKFTLEVPESIISGAQAIVFQGEYWRRVSYKSFELVDKITDLDSHFTMKKVLGHES